MMSWTSCRCDCGSPGAKGDGGVAAAWEEAVAGDAVAACGVSPRAAGRGRRTSQTTNTAAITTAAPTARTRRPIGTPRRCSVRPDQSSAPTYVGPERPSRRPARAEAPGTRRPPQGRACHAVRRRGGWASPATSARFHPGVQAGGHRLSCGTRRAFVRQPATRTSQCILRPCTRGRFCGGRRAAGSGRSKARAIARDNCERPPGTGLRSRSGWLNSVRSMVQPYRGPSTS
jgi:hypothetical protein